MSQEESREEEHAESETQGLLEPPQPKPATGDKPSTLLTVCPFILGNELCERLAYYGLATNLVTYMTRVMGGEPANAAILVAVFEGSCYTTPIIGALLADSVWGRYKTIMVFSVVYLLGIVLLTISSVIPDSEEDAETANPLQYGVLFASLGVISLGTGGIKPNVSAFGADQFNEADPQDRKEKDSFFNWFYLAINVGSLFASTVVVYIQDSVSWTIGFAIPGVAMLAAIGLFWAGRRGYRHVLPTESPMVRVVKVVSAAMKNRWTKHTSPDPSVAEHRVIVPPSDTPAQQASYHGGQLYQQAGVPRKSAYIPVPSADPEHGPSEPGDGSAGGAAVNGIPRASSMHEMPLRASMSYRWLEEAVTEWQTAQGLMVHTGSLAGFTPKQVEEVKLVIRLLPIFCTTVMYWTVYTQMGTLFVQQGNLMNRDVPWRGNVFKIPSASMALFNTLSVIVLVSVYDRLLEPALKRTRRFRMTLLRRQGWGMVVAAVAMAYAGGLEAWRLSTLPNLEPCQSSVSCNSASTPGRHLMGLGDAWAASNAGATDAFFGATGPFGGAGNAFRRVLFQAGRGAEPTSDAADGLSGAHDCMCPNQPAPLSIFWQAPSYFLIALSEVFTSIGQLEFFYDQAPDVMRSCSMALCLLSTAMGSYLAGALTWAVEALSEPITGTPWLPRDLNKGHIDWFFYVLMVVMLANLGAFLAVAINYQYKTVEHKRQLAPRPALNADGTAGATPAPGGQAAVTTTVSFSAPSGPLFRHGSAPMMIGGGRGGLTDAAAQSDMEVYSRSLAYVPPSPNIPAPFR